MENKITAQFQQHQLQITYKNHFFSATNRHSQGAQNCIIYSLYSMYATLKYLMHYKIELVTIIETYVYPV
jgi:hypothetical protein